MSAEPSALETVAPTATFDSMPMSLPDVIRTLGVSPRALVRALVESFLDSVNAADRPLATIHREVLDLNALADDEFDRLLRSGALPVWEDGPTAAVKQVMEFLPL